MDIVFGSSGVAQADRERMAQINHEIGLDARLRGTIDRSGSEDEKMGGGFDEKGDAGIATEQPGRTVHLR